MHLDVYRSCSFREKRDVLNTFWRTDTTPTSRIGEAAVQYGYYAVICLAVVVAELTLILVVSITHGSLIAWLTAVGDVLVVWSTWWAVRRFRTLKTQFSQ